MKSKIFTLLEIFIESINYIIINYALSNVAMLLKNNPIFILLFASEIWVMGNFSNKVFDLTKNKFISIALVLFCFAIHIVMIYYVGHIVGEVVPFAKF